MEFMGIPKWPTLTSISSQRARCMTLTSGSSNQKPHSKKERHQNEKTRSVGNFDFALDSGGGGQSTDCVDCLYNSQLKGMYCTYTNVGAETCTQTTTRNGQPQCFTSGSCGSSGGGGGGGGCDYGRVPGPNDICIDPGEGMITKMGAKAAPISSASAPHCTRILVDLPVTEKLTAQHPWVNAPELDAKLVAESAVPEMGDLLDSLRRYIKTHGVPTRFTVSMNDAGATLTLEKDGNFHLRVYSAPTTAVRTNWKRSTRNQPK